jgi:hypothetical protein
MKKSIYIIMYMMLVTGCEDLTPSRNMPQTVSVSVSDIGETSAVCHLAITPKGATQKSGIIYGIDPLLQAGTLEAITSGSDVDVITLSSLNGGVTYYLKPYAADKMDAHVYGDIQSFTTVKVTTLSLSPSSIDALSSAGSYKLNISCNDTWTIASNQSWCTLQPSSGTGSGEVTVSVQENAIPADRVIVLTVTTGNISKQVSIQQDGGAIINASEFGNGITAAPSFGGGDGTQSNPYLISGAQQLKKLVDDVNNEQTYSDTYFKLTTNIHITANEWVPIGYSRSHFNMGFVEYHTPFEGVFDGDGHIISGTLKSAQNSSLGFFGTIIDAVIYNLTIAATVRNEYSEPETLVYTGALAGYARNSIIQNCTIFGTVAKMGVESSSIGGVAGAIFSGNISNCTVFGAINGGGDAGGIVGVTRDTDITNCTVSASGGINSQAFAGGIAGFFADSGTISGCTNHSPVNGITNSTGGLVGVFAGDVKIHTSLNTGNVTSSGHNTGGLAGFNHGYVYSCCTNRGYVNGQPPSNENQIGGDTAGVIPCPDGHAKR